MEFTSPNAVTNGEVISLNFSENLDKDCNEQCFGDAVLDFCDDCTGGTTDLSFNQNLGCTEDGSEPTLDDCDSGYELDSKEECCDGAIQTTWFDDTDGDMLGDSSMEYELCFPEE